MMSYWRDRVVTLTEGKEEATAGSGASGRVIAVANSMLAKDFQQAYACLKFQQAWW